MLINGEYEYGEIILLIDWFDKELGDGENGLVFLHQGEFIKDLAWDVLVYEEPTINNIISSVITADGDNICSNNFVQYNNDKVWIIIWESNEIIRLGKVIVKGFSFYYYYYCFLKKNNNNNGYININWYNSR